MTGPLGSITGHYDSLSNIINDRVGPTGRLLPLAGLNSETKQGSSSTMGFISGRIQRKQSRRKKEGAKSAFIFWEKNQLGRPKKER